MRLKALYFFFLSIFISCEHSQDSSILSLEIEFDGAKEEFYKKYNLWNEVKDSLIITQLLTSFDTSKLLLVCPPIKPVMWQIDVFADYGNNKSQHLFKINSNTYGRLSLQKNGRCYENNQLIDIMTDIMKVEEIRKYSGVMSQSDYDKIILNNHKH